jgi:hypothetical protein
MLKLTRTMSGQWIYGSMGSGLNYPEIQMKKLFAIPVERELVARTQTQEHKDLCRKLFVFKVMLLPQHTTESWEPTDDNAMDNNDVHVWRIATCFGGMTLDNFHDRVLGPICGWTRHYHSYQYTVPQNGAQFGPKGSTSIDCMHTTLDYTLDDKSFTLAHVLRKQGDKLVYVYDMGDNWKHSIELLHAVDVGEDVNLPEMVTADTNPTGSVTINTTALLCGAVNCPPEDSNGCAGMGKYWSILKLGPRHRSCPRSDEANSTNWRAHNILKAYQFDLCAHQQRLADALSGKKSEAGGQKQCVFPIGNDDTGEGFSLFFGGSSAGSRNLSQGIMNERVSVKPDAAEVAVCGQCGRQPNSSTSAGETALVRCGACKSAWYCNARCQKQHWSAHKALCKAMKQERKVYKKEQK